MANTVQKIILNTDIRTLSLLAGVCLHTVFVAHKPDINPAIRFSRARLGF